MTDEMLVAQAEWLPQYAASIPLAKARLEAYEADGTRVKTMDGFAGRARLHTKTVRRWRRRKRKPATTRKPPIKAK